MRDMTYFKKLRRRGPWQATIISVVVALGLALLGLCMGAKSFESIGIGLGVWAALISFFSLRNSDSQFQYNLFKDFNAIYDDMNNDLQKIKTMSELKSENKSILTDYFNLCAEQYLWRERSYVPDDVWIYWKRGMMAYWENPAIQVFWKTELETETYYGMTAGFFEEKTSVSENDDAPSHG